MGIWNVADATCDACGRSCDEVTPVPSGSRKELLAGWLVADGWEVAASHEYEEIDAICPECLEENRQEAVEGTCKMLQALEGGP